MCSVNTPCPYHLGGTPNQSMIIQAPSTFLFILFAFSFIRIFTDTKLAHLHFAEDVLVLPHLRCNTEGMMRKAIDAM